MMGRFGFSPRRCVAYLSPFPIVASNYRGFEDERLSTRANGLRIGSDEHGSDDGELVQVPLDGIDVLEGPREITLTSEPAATMQMTVHGKLCPPSNGGHLIIAAGNDIHDAKEANPVVRLRYKSKGIPNNSWTVRWHLLMYPAAPLGGLPKQAVEKTE